MAIEAGLTMGGLIKEVTTTLRSSRKTWGGAIEDYISNARLTWIAGNDHHGNYPKFNQIGQGVNIFLNGLLQDYREVTQNAPGLPAAIKRFAQTNINEINAEFQQTAREYGALRFSETDDVSRVAKDDYEKGLLKEAAQLLGYQVQDEPDSTRFKLPPRHELPVDADKAIKTRINVGISNLLVDYDSIKTIRRPIKRTIVAMADHMARHLRSNK